MSMLQMTARKAADILGRDSWVVQRLRPTFESLLAHASGGKGILWEINGVTYRIDPHYRHQLGQEYDAPVAAFLRERVKPGAVCFDVGANVGVYVLQFAHWAGPQGRVIAFEPNPSARTVLERHVRLNDLTEQVTIVPAAVGERSGEAAFFAADADGMSRLGEPNQLIAERVSMQTVPVVTLDEYCASQNLHPDWLFIDIEGFEIAALTGARKLLTGGGAPPDIVVEMHPDVWSSADTTRDKAEQLLTELGRRAVPLTGQSDPLAEYGLIYLAGV